MRFIRLIRPVGGCNGVMTKGLIKVRSRNILIKSCYVCGSVSTVIPITIQSYHQLWFREHCDPYNDPELPPAPNELVVEMASRYIDIYERITGKAFEFPEGNVNERIERNLKRFFAS